MNKYGSRIRRLRKEILELESEIEKLWENRKRILRILHRANLEYKQGKISYEKYSEIWDSTLKGHSVKSLLKKYDSRLRKLKREIKDRENRVKELRSRKDKANKALSVSLALLLVFGATMGLGLFGEELAGITGFAVANQSIETTQTLEIQAYYAIDLSTSNIQFGALEHDTQDNNATLNYNASDESEYYIHLSNDSNVNAKVNISASGPMTNDAGNQIGEGNMTWNSSYSISNSTDPALPGTQMSTTEGVSSSTLTPGDKQFYRFWIDIPVGTPPGAYNNTITFESYQSS